MKISILSKYIAVINFIVIVICTLIAIKKSNPWNFNMICDVIMCLVIAILFFILGKRYIHISDRTMQKNTYIFLTVGGLVLVILQNLMLYFEIANVGKSISAALFAIAAYNMFSNAIVYEKILEEKGRYN